MTGRRRGFRFGVIAEGAHTAEGLLALGRRAELLGYSTLLLRDHFVREPFGDQLAPMVALTAVAAATRALRVGTLVLDNDYRHPVLLAKEAATLDRLSGGRFELGIGAGWLREEYGRAGIPFDPPGVRVDRLGEALTVLKGLLGGEPFSFAGKHYTIDGLQSFPAPAQRPHPPLLVGAGSRRMLGIAGRQADVAGILPRAMPDGTISDALSERSTETLARKVDAVRTAAAERADGVDVELSMVVSVVLAADHRAAAERLAVERGWGAAAAGAVLDMPSILLGSEARVADLLHTRRDRLGFSYLVVSDEDMETFAPIVERLAGA
jgi:probable F420-dependent oxidoreductase